MKPEAPAAPPEATTASLMSPLIVRSWKRSSACGLRQDAPVELPYQGNYDADSRLLRAAQPVLERLVETMSDTHHSIFLADRDARIIDRMVGTKSLVHTLDKAYIAPGFEFPEELAGTNGVGTALEEASVVVVLGTEHFSQYLHEFACVGVPIRHPILGTTEGIVDFTCFAKDYNPLIRPLLIEVAKHIETRLSQDASAAQVALLETFVRTCRTHRGPVVALRPDIFLTNTPASDHLGSADQAVLWDAATTLASMGRDNGFVDLASGRFQLRLTTVDTGGREAPGFVCRLAHEGPPPPKARSMVRVARPSAPTLPGRSPQWKRVREQLDALANSADPVAITGEPGTGKVHLAKHLHRSSSRGSGVRIFDAAAESNDLGTGIIDRCHDTLGNGDTVIIRRIDLLPTATLGRLGDLARQPNAPGRLVVTCDDAASEAAERTLAACAQYVWLPPLRQRSDDIADLVPALLADLAPGRQARCASPAVQALMRYPWPGNTTELRDVLTSALVKAQSGEIGLSHLPPWILKRAHLRRFSPMEQAERELIISTLASVSNNRTEAARILGIGRATLYRRLRTLGIATDSELVR
ncbi:sigma-54-dependent Fis family transcriptional regulator [Nocardia sp. NPDC057272]|uniref:sigma-54-dependent Fis family transcriptional regulator n=1 Tax=Nocardia sp. NPDC057272 TaxID=3346079 RepID=UPI0036278BD7